MGSDDVTGVSDSVDAILEQWHRERPDLPVGPVGIMTRLARVRTHLDGALTEVFDGYDLTPADFQALVTLRRIGPPFRMGQARLMKVMGLTSGTISLRLARLEQRGVVVREPDPDDKRGSLVRLTAEGLDLFDRIAPVHLLGEDRLLSALTPDEQDQLAGLLRRLLGSFEHTGARASRAWGMTLEPAHVARRRRAEVGLSDHAGLLVTRVQAGSAAQLAGVQPGDLLTRIADRPVRSPDDLIDGLAGPLALTLLRADERTEAVLHPPATEPT